MKTRNIVYWIATALTAFSFLSGGVMYLIRAEPVMEGIALVSYPTYFLSILGVWKLLGGLAVLAPKLPLLKEWAYAGMVFNLTGAAASHAFSGHGIVEILTPIFVLVFVVLSWWLRPASRRLDLRAREHAA